MACSTRVGAWTTRLLRVGLFAEESVLFSNNAPLRRGHCRCLTTSRRTQQAVESNKYGGGGAPINKVTLPTLRRLKQDKMPITMVTAVDYPSGVAVDRAGIDVCLVGDSLAMVALGYEDTSQVTLDDMIHHSKAVKRGCRRAFMVTDMPFGSYEVSPQQAVQSAIRLVKEGGAEAVKLEGGAEMAETIKAITRVGIPVLGHVGLTPQRKAGLGGYRVQGTTGEKAVQLLQDTLALEEAGCFAVVLEAVPSLVAHVISKQVDIPTIGIGAGPGTSGQVLVMNDLLGIFDRFSPKFCKRYAELGQITQHALSEYAAEVRQGLFPAQEHQYTIKPLEYQRFLELIGQEEPLEAYA